MSPTQTAPVRLTPQQVDIIRAAVADIFGAGAGVWLFGSRTDTGQRGGDIDLYIETPCDTVAALQRELGEQRIDIVTRSPGEPEQTIHRAARAGGVPL